VKEAIGREERRRYKEGWGGGEEGGGSGKKEGGEGAEGGRERGRDERWGREEER